MTANLNTLYNEVEALRAAELLIDNCDALPSTSRAVAVNLLAQGSLGPMMTYLLGVADALYDVDMKRGAAATQMRREVRDLLRGQ